MGGEMSDPMSLQVCSCLFDYLSVCLSDWADVVKNVWLLYACFHQFVIKHSQMDFSLIVFYVSAIVQPQDFQGTDGFGQWLEISKSHRQGQVKHAQTNKQTKIKSRK
jgi:hypothetical protein